MNKLPPKRAFLPTNKTPRYLLLSFALLAIIMPLISVYGIYPQYRQQIIGSTEKDAILLASHLSKMGIVSQENFGLLFIDDDIVAELKQIQDDFKLAKIKVFNATGEVIYSSDSSDIGDQNSKQYFHEIVAFGSIFTKYVKKSQKSLEGEILEKSVVETYVPIMLGEKFIGAYEIYYDISAIEKDLLKVFTISLLYPVVIMLLFLILIYFVLFRLDRQINERQRTNALLKEKQRALVIEQEQHEVLFNRIESAKLQWEATMDCVSDLVILTDQDFVVLRCNKSVLNFCELDFREVIGRNCTELIGDNSFWQDIGQGGTKEYQHEATGEWFSVNVYSLSVKGDLANGKVVTLHDVTEIKLMTTALEDKNQEIKLYSDKLQSALDQITALIQKVVEEGSFGSYFDNEGLKRCYEVMNCQKTDCPCYGKDPMRCWQSAGTFCGGKVQGEFAGKYSSCIKCKHFKEATSDPVYMIGEQFNNMMHILETKNKELQGAYAELKQTQSQILQQEKMASIGQLAAGVAHEINNPVGFISSNLGSLDKYTKRLNSFISFQASLIDKLNNTETLEQLATHRKKEKLDYIQQDIGELITESLDGCERVRKIVQDLKGFSRVDQADRQVTDLNECLESTFNIVRNELKYKAILEKDYGDLELLECFPQQLNQVFMNLLINAVQAIEESGTITVKTWQQEQNIYVSVSDSGKGISPEDLEHIFEPFFTTKDVGEGTGLGLSIVYDIISKNHHGEIIAESEVGKGTVFTVKLPLNIES